MPHFTKKPVTIEARRLVGNAGETMKVAQWIVDNGYPWLLGDATQPETLVPETEPAIPGAGLWIDPGTGELVIRTLEGDMRVSYGDWVIKGVQGEFYPCKPDIFEATYEELKSEFLSDVNECSAATSWGSTGAMAGHKHRCAIPLDEHKVQIGLRQHTCQCGSSWKTREAG